MFIDEIGHILALTLIFRDVPIGTMLLGLRLPPIPCDCLSACFRKKKLLHCDIIENIFQTFCKFASDTLSLSYEHGVIRNKNNVGVVELGEKSKSTDCWIYR